MWSFSNRICANVCKLGELQKSKVKTKDRLKGYWKYATVFIAGMGALGCEVAKNLALMGIGKLIIADYDEIEVSNVSRQMLFCIEDSGKPKVEVAKQRLKELNPHVEVEAFYAKIEEEQTECILNYGVYPIPPAPLINESILI